MSCIAKYEGDTGYNIMKQSYVSIFFADQNKSMLAVW